MRLALLDLDGAMRDLGRKELQSLTRRGVVEENAGAREQIVALAVVDRDVVAVDFRHAVGAAWVEWRLLVLWRLPYLAEHLRAAGLVKLDLRVQDAHGFE